MKSLFRQRERLVRRRLTCFDIVLERIAQLVSPVIDTPMYVSRESLLKKPYAMTRTPKSKTNAKTMMLVITGVVVLIDLCGIAYSPHEMCS